MIFSVNWRYIYFLSIGLRFLFALSDSYIHPDEHFQSLEVLASKILNLSSNIPWEFQSNPIRSYVPLYFVYGPILYIVKLLGLEYAPLQIWYLIRIQNVILGWLITDYCLYRLLPNKPERIKAIYFTSTSFITLVFQSHCFSNSIETYIVLISILIIDEIRSSESIKQHSRSRNSKLLFILGFLISFGIFNRITFPTFLIFPFWFVLRYLKSHFIGAFWLSIGFIIPTVLFIIIDSLCYSSLTINEILTAPLNFNNYTLTPWNNILYNINVDNLKLHGYHARYIHLLINLPQMLGPGLFLTFYKLKNTYWKTTPFLGALSGLCFLSIFPHQELRFLIPILPLLCSCFDLKIFSKEMTTINTSLPTIFGSLIINTWYIFNLLMAVLMGIYHQGGVVPVLNHFHELKNSSDKFIQIWWRTYSPPTWILGFDENLVETLSINNEIPTLFNKEKNYIIDAMGSDFNTLIDTFENLRGNKLNHTIYLITPTASFNIDLNEVSDNFKEFWSYKYHLDMDHLDFGNIESLTPGISVYEFI